MKLSPAFNREAQVERAECCIRMCGSPLIRIARASFVARVFFPFFPTPTPPFFPPLTFVKTRASWREIQGGKTNTVTNRNWKIKKKAQVASRGGRGLSCTEQNNSAEQSEQLPIKTTRLS